MSVTEEVSHPDMSPSKVEASWNMPDMSFTEDVFHPERSPLKDEAPANV